MKLCDMFASFVLFEKIEIVEWKRKTLGLVPNNFRQTKARPHSTQAKGAQNKCSARNMEEYLPVLIGNYDRQTNTPTNQQTDIRVRREDTISIRYYS